MKNLVFFALLNAHTTLAGSADYHFIDGAYIHLDAPGISGHCSLFPSVNAGPLNQACQSEQGPDIDLIHQNNYRGNALSESMMLTPVGLNHAEYANSPIQQQDKDKGFNDNWLFWYPRSSSSVSKLTTYFHKTRCGDGEGEQVKNGVHLYKKCTDHGLPVVNNTFHLPPNVCLGTCDENVACIGYTIDEAGSTCSILNKGLTDAAKYHYQLIGQGQEGGIRGGSASTENGAFQKSVESSGTPSDYFAFVGSYYGHGSAGGCIRIDNGTKFDNGCPRVHGSEFDQQSKLMYPLPLLPESTLLALADFENVDVAQTVPDQGPYQQLMTNRFIWHPATASTASKQTTYVHMTRCGDGYGDGQRIATDKSVYKKCKGRASALCIVGHLHAKGYTLTDLSVGSYIGATFTH
jgi:hypothetical protein